MQQLSNRVIIKGTWARYKGMYIGVPNDPSQKINANILQTYVESTDPMDYYDFPDKERTYRRKTAIKENGQIKGYREVGEAKRVRGYYQTPLYNSLKEAWQVLPEYSQVSYGLKASRRDALIIDSDNTYSSLQAAVESVNIFVSKTGIPTPNYILLNPKSYHIQLGWFLSTPFKKYNGDYTRRTFRDYNAYTKELARIWSDVTSFEGDICFNGPSCKNPFYTGFQYRILKDDETNTDYLVNTITSYAYQHNLSVNVKTRKVSRTYKESIKLNTSRNSRNNLSNVSSRRAYEINNLRTYLFRELNKGNNPTEKELFIKVKELAKEAAIILKKDIHSEKELYDIVSLVNTFCHNNYNPSHKGGLFTEQGRAFGRLVQQFQKFSLLVKVLDPINKDLSTREIAKIYGITQTTVNQYRKMGIHEVSQLADKVQTFIRYCVRFGKNISLDYKRKMLTLKYALKQYKKRLLNRIVVPQMTLEDFFIDPVLFQKLQTQVIGKVPILSS